MEAWVWFVSLKSLMAYINSTLQLKPNAGGEHCGECKERLETAREEATRAAVTEETGRNVEKSL